MRALQYISARNVASTEVASAAPTAEQVQIRVAYTGLCGTDLHIFHGDMDSRVAHPLVFGHEMSGEISAVGDDAHGWTTGDRVTVMPLSWDGTCPACQEGNEHICQNLDFIGIDSPGSLQELWNVPATVLLRLPDVLTLRDGALVEPVAVAVHDVRRSELGTGDKAVVIGGGPIGVLIATVARHFGAEVVVIEPDAGRRESIENLGFVTVDPLAVDQTAHVEKWTDGAGADVVFEVSGAAAAVKGMTALAKVRGTIVVVAIHSQPRELDLQRVFWRELRLLGARVYQRADFETAIELLAAGVIPTDTIITGVVDLEDTGAAIEQLESGEALKLMVSVGGGR